MSGKSLAERRRWYVFKSPARFLPVRRDEIHGAGAMLCAIDPLIERVREFRRLSKLGSHLDGGALFYGPKGTGKTYFARYLATAGNARFIDVRGFPRLMIGGQEMPFSARDIRILYQLAREYVARDKKPIVLFYDEFEGVDDEVISQLKIEIDGINGKSLGVFLVVISAVDDPASLDDGLMRAGRVGIHIPFGYPTADGRVELLQYYLSRHSHGENIDVRSIGYLCDDDTTPADIEQLVSNAYHAACLEKKEKRAVITQKHLLERCMQTLVGFVVDSNLDDAAKLCVACHEAGHAALFRALDLPVQLVTILPTQKTSESTVQGRTVSRSQTGDLITADNVDILKKIMIAGFGGIVADSMLGKAFYMGSGQDLAVITGIAHRLVELFTQGKTVQEHYGSTVLFRGKGEYSYRLRERIEHDVARFVRVAEKKAHMLMIKKVGKTRLLRVAQALVEKKVLLQNELDEVLQLNKNNKTPR